MPVELLRQMWPADHFYNDETMKIEFPSGDPLAGRRTIIWGHHPLMHSGGKAFLSAIKRNDIQYVKDQLLYKNPYLVFEYDNQFQSGLIWAVRRNLLEMTQLLLQNNARVDWQDELGRTALYFAVKNQNLKIVKCLLMHKANPAIKSRVKVLQRVVQPPGKQRQPPEQQPDATENRLDSPEFPKVCAEDLSQANKSQLLAQKLESSGD